MLDCRVLLTTDPQPPTVAPVLAAIPLEVLTAPSVDDLLTKSYPHFPYLKTFQEARNEPFVALHTSGTTGTRKRFERKDKLLLTAIRTAKAYHIHS